MTRSSNANLLNYNISCSLQVIKKLRESDLHQGYGNNANSFFFLVYVYFTSIYRWAIEIENLFIEISWCKFFEFYHMAVICPPFMHLSLLVNDEEDTNKTILKINNLFFDKWCKYFLAGQFVVNCIFLQVKITLKILHER